MQNVFINRQGEMSITQKPDSIQVGEIHRMRGRNSFADQIEVENHNGIMAHELTRETAYRATQNPQNKGVTIVYVDNIQAL